MESALDQTAPTSVVLLLPLPKKGNDCYSGHVFTGTDSG